MTLERMFRRCFAVRAIATASAAAAVMTSCPATAPPADGQIRPAGSIEVVPNSYVVVFKDTAATGDQVNSRAEKLTAKFGGRTGHLYHNALRGFEVSLPEPAARRLAADPSVAYVQQNGVYTISSTQSPTPSWGLDRIDQRALPLNNSYTYPTTASGVKAYIIDSGIRLTHTDFGGRAISGVDEIDGGSADDGHGHGTHVAANVGGSRFGVAKGVTLVAVRVMNNFGSGTTAGVVAGVDWVTGDHKAGQLAVANISLRNGIDNTLDTAVANSIADGITYAIAAGNDNSDACNQSPARVAAAITVGSTTTTDARASDSNFGTCLDIFAPGQDITSAWNTSDTATATVSGTSMATPHVTGAAALVLAQYPSFTPQQVRDTLVANAAKGVVTGPGTGSPNKLLFVIDYGTIRALVQGFDGQLTALAIAGGVIGSGALMAAGTSPAITKLSTPGVTETAFVGQDNKLWRAFPLTNFFHAGFEVGRTLDVAVGTSPAVAADNAGGWKIAFHGANGHLWTIDSASNIIDTGAMLAPGSNPALTYLPTFGGYEITFAGEDNLLWRAFPDTNWFHIMAGPFTLGVAPGTSPAIASNGSGSWKIAFVAPDHHLWTSDSFGDTHDTGASMAAGSSPALAYLPTFGGYEITFAGEDNLLWRAFPDTNWFRVMAGLYTLSVASGTSPAVIAVGSNNWKIAFVAPDQHLWTTDSTATQDTGVVMAANTNPAIAK